MGTCVGREVRGGASHLAAFKMAACAYLLLLTCVLGHLPPELAHLPKERVPHEESLHRQHSQISVVGHRIEPPPRLHRGQSRKVSSFPETVQQKKNPLHFMRRRHNSHILRDEKHLVDDEAMAGHKEYYLPRPPPRMHPHVYEDPVHHAEEEVVRDGTREVILPESSFGVSPHIYQEPAFRNEWNGNHGRIEYRNRMPHHESFEKMFADLEDEKLKQANKHHNVAHEHEHKHEHEHRPTIEHNNYWIIGQKRFRMIVIIMLAVIVCFIILLILACFLHPNKNTSAKKTRSKK